MYAEREIFGPASLSMLAMRSSERVREVLAFILPLYYRSRIPATVRWSAAGSISSSSGSRPVKDQRGFRGISSLRGDYHQQYLAKNPDGYCGIGGCGVPFKVAELQVGEKA